MFFLSFSNVDVYFANLEKLNYRFYTIAEALSTTIWVELINQREFGKVVLDKNWGIYVIYMAAQNISEAIIYLLRTA